MIKVRTDNLRNILPATTGPNVDEFETLRGIWLPAFLIRNSNPYTVYHQDVLSELIDGSFDLNDGDLLRLNRWTNTLYAIQYKNNSRVFIVLSNMITAVFSKYISTVFGLDSCKLIYNNLPLPLTKEIHEVFDPLVINVVTNADQ
jgi:hypothetical protein